MTPPWNESLWWLPFPCLHLLEGASSIKDALEQMGEYKSDFIIYLISFLTFILDISVNKKN